MILKSALPFQQKYACLRKRLSCSSICPRKKYLHTLINKNQGRRGQEGPLCSQINKKDIHFIKTGHLKNLSPVHLRDLCFRLAWCPNWIDFAVECRKWSLRVPQTERKRWVKWIYDTCSINSDHLTPISEFKKGIYSLLVIVFSEIYYLCVYYILQITVCHNNSYCMTLFLPTSSHYHVSKQLIEKVSLATPLPPLCRKMTWSRWPVS